MGVQFSLHADTMLHCTYCGLSFPYKDIVRNEGKDLYCCPGCDYKVTGQVFWEMMKGPHGIHPGIHNTGDNPKWSPRQPEVINSVAVLAQSLSAAVALLRDALDSDNQDDNEEEFQKKIQALLEILFELVEGSDYAIPSTTMKRLILQKKPDVFTAELLESYQEPAMEPIKVKFPDEPFPKQKSGLQTIIENEKPPTWKDYVDAGTPLSKEVLDEILFDKTLGHIWNPTNNHT